LDPKAAQQLPITTFAQVTGAWTVQGQEVVKALNGLHVWSEVSQEEVNLYLGMQVIE